MFLFSSRFYWKRFCSFSNRRRNLSEDTIKFIGWLLLVGVCCWFLWWNGKVIQEQKAWLRVCAEHTHGSLEREPDGETYYTSSKGYPTGSSVNWHYYVRTRSGKRVEYGETFEEE